ncbi:MAG TPA: PsbP-related protein [Desulfobacteria bacterium]|nr:PsbP-related protein [Desulfobacteria bacterium]
MSGKLVVLGRKKLLWTFALLAFVVAPLMVATYSVPVAEVSDPEAKMTTYTSEKEGVKFNYPQGWLLRTEKYSEGDISETVTFSNPEGSVHGFVQVMLLKQPIPEYIGQAQKSMAAGYDSLQFSTKKIGEKSGYMLAYARGTGDARTIAAEYFFRQNEKVYRFSCFYPDSQAEQYQKIFKEMLVSYSYPIEPNASKQQPATGNSQKQTGGVITDEADTDKAVE